MDSSFVEEEMEESKVCGRILTVLSWILVVMTMPFSLIICFKVCSVGNYVLMFVIGKRMFYVPRVHREIFIFLCPIDKFASFDRKL